MSAIALLGAACSRAPQQPADPAAAARRAQWATLADLPDWSGVWEIDWRNTRGSPPKPAMQLTSEYQRRLDAYKKAQEKGENLQSQGANCVPPGLPGIMTQPYPIEFLYQPGRIVMLTEAYMQFRHIYTDGRQHPEDPDPAFMGHSIGHWEKDTLVIDSVGFAESTLLAAGRAAQRPAAYRRTHPQGEPGVDGDRDDADRSGGSGRTLHQHDFVPASRRRNPRVHLPREQPRCRR